MGLLDEVLKTIQAGGGAANDPRARPAPMPAPGPGAPASHGMSPMAKALLALLAIYAAKNLRRAPSQPTQPTSPSGRPGGTVSADTMPGGGGGLDDLLRGPLGGLLRGGQGAGTGAGGGLGDLLRGPLGGILGGAAAGTVLNGGLGDLLKQLQQNGHGEAVDSWIGQGPNRPIQGRDLESALGGDTLDALAGQTGMQRGDLLSGLSQELPRFVDGLTPEGRLMNEDEAEQMV